MCSNRDIQSHQENVSPPKSNGTETEARTKRSKMADTVQARPSSMMASLTYLTPQASKARLSSLPVAGGSPKELSLFRYHSTDSPAPVAVAKLTETTFAAPVFQPSQLRRELVLHVQVCDVIAYLHQRVNCDNVTRKPKRPRQTLQRFRPRLRCHQHWSGSSAVNSDFFIHKFRWSSQHNGAIPPPPPMPGLLSAPSVGKASR